MRIAYLFACALAGRASAFVGLSSGRVQGMACEVGAAAYSVASTTPLGVPRAGRKGLYFAGGVDSGDDKSPMTSEGKTLRTCRNCHSQFYPEDNNDEACRFHPGIFTGRLNRVNDVDTSGLEYFWSCCGEYELDHPGCVVTSHESYDDPPIQGWRSPLTGTHRD
ncbi:unnamed protein product [Choristocarpus tenellus]